MFLIAGLIALPLAAALLLLLVRNDKARTVLVVLVAVVLMVLAVALTAQYLFAPGGFIVPEHELIGYLALGTGLACCLYIVYRALRARRYFVAILALAQGALVIFYDLGLAHGAAVSTDIYVDQLSLIMVLIIAILGGGIGIYAIGYMRDYQEHLEHAQTANKPARDRRPVFFALLFLFLGAMFALVFSNRLSWLFTAWEVTTLCSFILIGFTRTEEATNNAFKAVSINLLGGLAFIVALILVAGEGLAIFELDILVAVGTEGRLTLPLMLIAFAGMTKAAQMPFQGWLLGAMVAPTPVSALLHSSTMVKAGVFVLIKLAPTFGWNIPGFFVLIVGGLTFLCCSALAISQSNAKRVLAYSTVANLGLIACCAGIGTPEAVWAAIFLLIFHAVAKALLFCCVGTAEHRIGSRDIESMDNIFVRLPWLASCMALGMMAMFVAPFGMLVSKWEALVSITQSGHLELLLVLAFGSALSFVFWAKWLGKVLSVGAPDQRMSGKTSFLERAVLVFFVFLLLAVTLALPFLSESFVLPFMRYTGALLALPAWMQATDALGNSNLMIMSIILMVFLVLLVVQVLRKKPTSHDTVYLAGVVANANTRSYYDSFGKERQATQRNWYLEQAFGERVLGRPSTLLLAAVMVLFILLGVITELMML